MKKFSFRDDYSEGTHPSILKALSVTNATQQIAYGQDEYCQDAKELIRQHFAGTDSDIWFVTSGTMANILCIGSALRPYEAVIAPASGHIVQREAGAIEAIGHKIISVPAENGKLTPDIIQSALDSNAGFPHMAKPRLVYISQATEMGTVYSRAEMTAISDLCRARDLFLLVDGARLGAAVTCDRGDLSLDHIAQLADIFWIGGTKTGALMGEAIVIPNTELRKDFAFHTKQRGALLAKGRILGVQFRELFREGLFFEGSRHANNVASHLSSGLKDKGVGFSFETETNQLFPILENEQIEELRQHFDFHVWKQEDTTHSVVRLVTSWATGYDMAEKFLKSF